jgi:hypothetical protein
MIPRTRIGCIQTAFVPAGYLVLEALAQANAAVGHGGRCYALDRKPADPGRRQREPPRCVCLQPTQRLRFILQFATP